VLPNTRRDAFRFSPEKDSLWHPVVLIVNYAAARRNRRRTGASDMIRFRARVLLDDSFRPGLDYLTRSFCRR
jgi:hypothetical protein